MYILFLSHENPTKKIDTENGTSWVEYSNQNTYRMRFRSLHDRKLVRRTPLKRSILVIWFKYEVRKKKEKSKEKKKLTDLVDVPFRHVDSAHISLLLDSHSRPLSVIERRPSMYRFARRLQPVGGVHLDSRLISPHVHSVVKPDVSELFNLKWRGQGGC